MKKCIICNKEFLMNETFFYKCKRNKTGFYNTCKSCFLKKNREYQRKIYKVNPEKCHNHSNNWKAKNREKVAEYNKKYRTKNSDYFKNYRIEHRKEITKYVRERRRNDLHFKIKSNLCCRLWWALKNNTKFAPTLKLLGCSIEELKTYLSSQFQPGMSWENYGEWHIDHIRPCTSFDLSKPEEQSKCFNYTNLQPLWAKDNISKGSKYVEK